MRYMRQSSKLTVPVKNSFDSEIKELGNNKRKKIFQYKVHMQGFRKSPKKLSQLLNEMINKRALQNTK